ncbi:lysine methyltransferase domain-containing protein [Sarocladium implicatum]|nr:lysine methyltransferase domain-containing protein [Sarocladium implicatum]
MTKPSRVLPPSLSLPPLATLRQCSQDEILSLISGLFEIYCPLSATLSSAFAPRQSKEAPHADRLCLPQVDSGYASEVNEDLDDPVPHRKDLSVIRTDSFERSCAQRWVSGFVIRAEDCPGFTSDDARQSAIEDAYTLMESLSTTPGADDEDEDPAEVGFRRDFVFETASSDSSVNVHLYDKLAGTKSSDPDDVGLQSWGASIFFSRLICKSPESFCLDHKLGASPRIVELGAGTGLVSLTLGALLPTTGHGNATLIATDYHAGVMENLKENIASNMADHASVPIETCVLDWSSPVWDPPLDKRAGMILATDVIYSPLHATWLRDCAASLLTPEGVFWLVVAVRQNGKFEGVSETVRGSFAADVQTDGLNGKKLKIMSHERLEKPDGIGRGDESWYELLKICWA